MRSITQSEMLRVSGSLCHDQFVGMLAFSLSFIGYCYHFFYALKMNAFNQDLRILPITAIPANIST